MPMSHRLLVPRYTYQLDAQNWLTRVYQNGGSVSADTAAAVNKFCIAIEAAGIRSRFHRLNLLCGDADASLNAVRTPLYLGDAIGVVVGNAMDANVGPFVQADYQEQGGSGGLDNATGNKYLNTGLKPNDATLPMPQNNCHMSVYGASLTSGPTATVSPTGVRHTGATNRTELFTKFGGSSSTRFASDADDVDINSNVSPVVIAATPATQGHIVGCSSSDTDLRLAIDGVAEPTQTATRAIGPNNANNIYVFCQANVATAQSFMSGRLMAYSIGKSLTNVQIGSFYTALQAFQTALGRQV